MQPVTLARLEARLRPLLTRLPPRLAIRVYSRGRRRFLDAFVRRPPREAYRPRGRERELWGLRFAAPLFNAAGMFKNGEGYDVVARQGAGAYLAGTTTHQVRRGNRRDGIDQPFVPYPRSRAASNWLGLPNLGHAEVARRLAAIERVDGCPVGASVAACPDPAVADDDKLAQLCAGMALYAGAGVDFLEVNESCPNTGAEPAEFAALRHRLEALAEGFLARRTRRLPVIVKLSCDTEIAQVPGVMATLVELGFDGVNFGNTSTAYGEHRAAVAAPERRLYDRFTRTFGGGLSGLPLRATSLALAAAAAAWLKQHPPGHEVRVVRTGGVADCEDLRLSDQAGVDLGQWYTGYFEAFARHGHGAYRELWRDSRAS